MSPELRERIIAHNKRVAEQRGKADDLDELLEKIRPILTVIKHLLPDGVKAIIKKYGQYDD